MSTQQQDVASEGATSTEQPASTPETGGEQWSVSDDAIGELPLEVVFEILRNERRRFVLEYLRNVEDETTLGDLAEHIAAIENDTTVEALSAQQRKRVYVGLYQCHLPKMADAGVVEFDSDRGTVRPGPHLDQFARFLDVSAGEDTDGVDVWHRSLAVGAVVAYLSAALGGTPGQVAGGAVVVTLVVALAVRAALGREAVRTAVRPA